MSSPPETCISPSPLLGNVNSTSAPPTHDSPQYPGKMQTVYFYITVRSGAVQLYAVHCCRDRDCMTCTPCCLMLEIACASLPRHPTPMTGASALGLPAAGPQDVAEQQHPGAGVFHSRG